MSSPEIVIFNDKAWVRYTEYEKLKERHEYELHLLKSGALKVVLTENDELKKRLSEKECFPQKKDGTIDTCEVMKEYDKLKAQIEKMKCCQNCSKSRIGKSCLYNFNNFDCKKDSHKEWELEE